MTLTQLSNRVRITINISTILIATLLIFKFVLTPSAKNVWKVIFPPKDPPTPIFGQIAPPEFIQKKTTNTNYTYVLNTTTGKLPMDIPTKMPVYKYKPAAFSYEAGKQATQDAIFLGFSEADRTTDLKGDTYRWKNTETRGNLEIDIYTKALKLETPMVGKSAQYIPGTIDETKAIRIAKEMFKATGRFDDVLYETGEQTVQLGKFYGNQIIEVGAVTEAQIARVDFFRSIDNYPIYGPDPKIGLLHAVVADLGRTLTILSYPKVQAHFWRIDPKTEATYPIIPINEAWDTIKKGGGIITNVTPTELSPFEDSRAVKVEKILVNDIYLAYYDDTKAQEYLQPIYVFEGNYVSTGERDKGSITLYLPAVTSEYFKSEQNNETP